MQQVVSWFCSVCVIFFHFLNMSVITEVFSTPKWLNNEFLEKHLQKYYKDNGIKVISFDVKPATGKGENYASLIHRVCVQFNAPIIKQGVSICSEKPKSESFHIYLKNIFSCIFFLEINCEFNSKRNGFG